MLNNHACNVSNVMLSIKLFPPSLNPDNFSVNF